MKVLLVNPEYPTTYWSFRYALSFEGKRSAFPPLALTTISSMLPASWERRLVDLNVRKLKRADIEWADIVFATAMLVQKDSLLEVVKRIKAQGKRIVVGGPYISSAIDRIPGVDHIFLGEAETTLPLFIEDLERGQAKEVYEAAERPSLAGTPIPDFGLVDLKRYSMMGVQYSRGCPFQCEFCDIIEIYGRVPRTKSPEQMLTELDSLLSVGWRGTVFIVDDNFIGNKRNVKQLLPRLAEWQERNGRPFTFITEASVNLADDDELLDGMRRAGFRRVFLGIETPEEEGLRSALKIQNIGGNLIESVKKIQSYGMEVMAGFIVGFDTDKDDIFQRQINFIRESAIPLAMVGLLGALPSTQLWRRLQSEGRLLGESLGNNTNGELNFIPKMDKDRLREGYRSIMQTIYRSSEYYDRTLECLKRISKTGPEKNNHSLVGSIVAFGRIILRLGIIDRERKEFWTFLTRVVRDHREMFADAMRLAVMGYHFRRIVDALNV
ncbi:MAG TPA: radical SAM protein [Blastocatellia bacterium]|nr:radical SAM protein [Blastocatellia bacterium]